MKAILQTSNKPEKKYMITFSGEDGKRNKTTHFGSAGMMDRTKFTDKAERTKRTKAYQARHAKDKITDYKSAGALSWYILWSADTLAAGIKNYEKKFGINVIKK